MHTKPNTTKKVFFSGVLLLTLSTVLVKVVGLVYKIPMLSYLGSEGMGYFHSAYEIYAVFCIIATAGLPVALSV
ncbi:MAG: oligosaccharide flippase family protein, partial [Clostridia bacterium]|nr:oligosaccharide flippase family protein [Clostridia bacterium]